MRLSAVAATLLCCPGAHAVELAPGSVLHARLTIPVSSRSSRAGDPVEAVVTAPVQQPGGDVDLSGCRLRGQVLTVRHGFARRAALKLRFDELVTPDGRRSRLDARVLDVDNAREAVAPDGTIVGLPGFSSRPSRAHLAVLIAAHAHPVLLAVFEAGRLAGRKVMHRAIDYGPGVDLSLALERPAVVPDASPVNEPATLPVALGVPGDFDRLVAGLPLRTVTPTQTRPSDITNLLLVGTRDEVEAAFTAAGWTRAQALRPRTAARGLLALVRRHSYRAAPVSLLDLEGRPPDLVFEKQCNTLTKRHHVRLWGGYGPPGGRPAWVGAATHDVGIGFSRAEFAFTHRVETQVDRERSKVVDDLRFGGRVAASELVDRPAAPRTFTTAAGARLETDGRMAVLVLGDAGAVGATTASTAP